MSQAAACLERALADDDEPFGQLDACQPGVPAERVVTDGDRAGTHGVVRDPRVHHTVEDEPFRCLAVQAALLVEQKVLGAPIDRERRIRADVG